MININKYYWICWGIENEYSSGMVSHNLYETVLVNIHPFTFIKEKRKIPQQEYSNLLNWREITEEEFNIFKQ